jgi:hypothetical protein
MRGLPFVDVAELAGSALPVSLNEIEPPAPLADPMSIDPDMPAGIPTPVAGRPHVAGAQSWDHNDTWWWRPHFDVHDGAPSSGRFGNACRQSRYQYDHQNGCTRLPSHLHRAHNAGVPFPMTYVPSPP